MDNKPIEFVEWSGEFHEFNSSDAMILAGVAGAMLALVAIAVWFGWRILRRRK